MWRKVAKLSEIQEGRSLVIDADSKPIALFKVQGAVHALDNSCPHQGGPLGEGSLEGFEVTCPWHAWTFDVKTGDCQSAPGLKQSSYPVKVEGDDVFVEINHSSL